MLSASGISQSGMLAASNMLRVSSNNIANANTEGFKKDVVSLKEGENGGVGVSVTKSNKTSTVFMADRGKIVETSNVEFAEEAINQIVVKHQFSANLKALKTTIETESEILDILA